MKCNVWSLKPHLMFLNPLLSPNCAVSLSSFKLFFCAFQLIVLFFIACKCLVFGSLTDLTISTCSQQTPLHNPSDKSMHISFIDFLTPNFMSVTALYLQFVLPSFSSKSNLLVNIFLVLTWVKHIGGPMLGDFPSVAQKKWLFPVSSDWPH